MNKPQKVSINKDKIAKPCEQRVGARDGGGGTTRAKASKGNAKKAPGGSGGHKFEWSDKTNDGSTSQLLGALDSGDPMWSSGAEDENYVLVSGESAGVVPTGASATFCAEHSKVLIGPKFTLAEFKRRVSEAFDELFLSGDIDEAVRSIKELGCPEFAFEVVKRGISKAIDREARERELTSRCLSCAVPAKLLDTKDVARGFERLFEAMDDLCLDAPAAPQIVGDFLVRCVVDEALPPAYLVDRVFCALGGEIVKKACRLLSREHAGAKLEKIWGPGDGRDAAELKLVVDQILGEYIVSRDAEEALRCVRELDAPLFGHEVVKRAVALALPRDADAREATSALLCALCASAVPLLSAHQAQIGFKRLRDALPDLTLDVPNAAQILDQFEVRARADKVIPADEQQ